jgi:hypothetical protein
LWTLRPKAFAGAGYFPATALAASAAAA